MTTTWSSSSERPVDEVIVSSNFEDEDELVLEVALEQADRTTRDHAAFVARR